MCHLCVDFICRSWVGGVSNFKYRYFRWLGLMGFNIIVISLVLVCEGFLMFKNSFLVRYVQYLSSERALA